MPECLIVLPSSWARSASPAPVFDQRNVAPGPRMAEGARIMARSLLDKAP